MGDQSRRNIWYKTSIMVYYKSMGIIKSFFRSELNNILHSQLDYLMKQFPDGFTALEEAEGQIAEFLNQQMRKAYVAGHAEGAQSVIQDEDLQNRIVFSPETDALWSARKYEDWKSNQ